MVLECLALTHLVACAALGESQPVFSGVLKPKCSSGALHLRLKVLQVLVTVRAIAPWPIVPWFPALAQDDVQR